MKTSLFKSTLIAGACLAGTLAAGPAAYADEMQYHGTECMTANLAQGQLFSWNKDGITNNSPLSLFVICPMTYDQDVAAGFGTPRADISVNQFVPGTGPNTSCLARFFNGFDSAAANVDTQTTISNQSFTVVTQSFQPAGDNDTGSVTVNINSNDTGNAHILCLLPAGSTLRWYSMRLLD